MNKDLHFSSDQAWSLCFVLQHVVQKLNFIWTQPNQDAPNVLHLVSCTYLYWATANGDWA